MTDQPAPAPPVHVHAWLDIACPWCWVAKRRFEAAVSELGAAVTVDYHSFELAPDLPADHVSSEADFLQRHYGISRADAALRMRLVTSTGSRVGLAFDLDRVQHTSTFLAHQLLQHGKAEGVQGPLLDALFSAFFEQGRDLRQVAELVAIAGEVGMPSAPVEEVLGSGRHAEAVRADRVLAAEHGVTSIPSYVLPGQEPIHGARRPEVILEALRKGST